MTKARRTIIEIIGTLAFAAVFFAIFATVVYLSIQEILSVSQAGFFLALVAANYCLRRICTDEWLSFNRRPKRDAKPEKDKRLGGSRDIVGEEYVSGEGVVQLLGLKLTIAHLIVPIVLIVMLPFNITGVTWMLLSIVMSAHSIWFALRKAPTKSMGFIFPVAIIFVVLAFWMAAWDNWFLIALYTPLLLFVITGRLVVVHMVKVDNSLKAAESSSQQAIGKIIKFNYKLLGGFVLTFSALVTALYFVLVRPMLVAISNFFEGLPTFEPVYITREEYMGITEHELSMGMMGPGPGLMQYLGPGRTSTVVNFILTVIFGSMLVLLLIAVVFMILRAVLRWFNLRVTKPGAAHQELLAEIEDEKEFIGLSSLRRGRRVKASTVKEHPLRRLFRETVKKYVKMGIPIKNTDTPTEMAVRVRDREFDGLAEEYSQVRYGN